MEHRWPGVLRARTRSGIRARSGFEVRSGSGPGAGACARLAVVSATATVIAQITFPLLSGTTLTVVTVVTVLLFTTAVVSHAAARYGPPTALRLLLVAGSVSLLVEAVGVRTGFPFGEYTYARSLGTAMAGVPVVVLLAWTMMAYPALLVARRLATSGSRRTLLGVRVPGVRVPRVRIPEPAAVAALGGITLAAWDLFLDPQLVTGGFWTWQHPDPGLPGVPGVPLTNLAGWLLVGTVLTALLDRLLPPISSTGPAPTIGTAPRAADAVPAALLAWTWLGSTLANLAFFDRPALAGYGFVALGTTVAPYLVLVARNTPATRNASATRNLRDARREAI